MPQANHANLNRVRAVISGRVQGVGFRYATQRQAQALDVLGWVRNRPDGRVEALFEGTEEGVARVVAWCRRGPSSAYVTDVALQEEAPTGEFHTFSIRW